MPATTETMVATFQDMESDIHDLVRVADLTQFVYESEQIHKEKISDDGATLLLVIEDLNARVHALKTKYLAAYGGD
jgi:hypothetical protein